jgi:uncharacterized protein YjdB
LAANIPAPARRRSGALRALVLAVLCAGCENAIAPPKTDNAVAAVAVTAPAATLQNGSSMQLSAAASNAAGQPLTRTFAWTSSSDAVATVAADGTVTGKSPGAVTITATSEGKSGTVALTITPVPIATVSVTPDTATLVVGATRQLAAVGRDASGGVLTGRLVAWASADSMIARVSVTGVVTARAAGSVVITATSEGKSGTATITVAPAPIATVSVSPDTATLVVGATRQLAAVARDASGAPLTGRPVSWASAEPAVASVSPTGLVTAHARGTAVITATSEGKSGTAAMTIVPEPIATVSVVPDTATLIVGTMRQLMAVGRDASGAVLTGRPVTWSSADPEIASVSAAGMVTARAAGSAVITATAEGKSGTATITVMPTTGTLRIDITSRGDLPDPDGYEILYNGQSMGKFGGSGGMEMANLQPGEYTVAIRSVSLYCSVDGSRDRTVTLAMGGTAVVEFVVTCRRDGMAYQVWDGTAASIFVHFPGRDVVTIPTTSIVSSSRMRWSPDGRRLLYAWTPPGGSTGPTYVDLDSLRVVRIPVNGIHPDPSPDGTRIAYVNGRTIRTARWDGSDEVTVWQSASTSIFPGMPTWSPDGSQIAFTKNDFSTGIATISMVNADGTGERVVRTLRTRPYLHIDWSPDGSRVVYPDQPAGSPYAIFTANVTTGAETRLIGTAGVDYHHPEYLRSGRIGFISQAQGGGPYRIWTVNADGTGLTERIIPGVTAASLPAWQ